VTRRLRIKVSAAAFAEAERGLADHARTLRAKRRRPRPDFDVTDDGSIVVIHPLSEGCRAWIATNVHAEPWQWLGGSLAVDHRYAGDLVEGLVAAGFARSP
jgi:hypothetical protein